METAFSDNRKAFVAEALKQMNRALLLLNDNVAKEFRYALHNVPELVQRESQSIDFLRTEDYHPFKAANRLALYWKTRREVFGDERWLLPMTQTGQGALSPEDLPILRSGFAQVVASPQLIIYVDFSKLPYGERALSVDKLYTCLFYLLSVNAVGNEQSQTEGMSIFHVITAVEYPVILSHSEMVKKLRESLPSKLKGIFFAMTKENGREQLLDNRLYEQQAGASANHGCLITKVGFDTVVGYSLQETLAQLLNRGFNKSALPVECGGDRDGSKSICDWIRLRLSIEDAMAGASPYRNNLSLDDIPFYPVAATALDRNSAMRRTSPTLIQRRPDESEAEFKRRRNLLYMERYKQKTLNKEMTLRDQCAQLQTQNAALRNNIRQLEDYLVQARIIVAEEENKEPFLDSLLCLM